MKKRGISILLCILMILSLLPVSVLAATDEQNVTLTIEETSTPNNGEFYGEGETLTLEIILTNHSTNQLSKYSIYQGNITSIYDTTPLEPQQSQETSRITTISSEDANAGEIIIDASATYYLNNQEYTIHETLTIKTGITPITLENVSAYRNNSNLRVSFESNRFGTYAYAVTEAGASAPENWDTYTKYDMEQGENSFTIPDFADDAATLYLMAWSSDGEPLAVPIQTEISPSVNSGFAALSQSTVLPIKEEVELGGEGTALYDFNHSITYAKLMKVELSEPQMILMNFYGTELSIDTCIGVYREENGSIEQVDHFDEDNQNNRGESARYIAIEPGIYYLSFEGYDEEETGLCALEVSLEEIPDNLILLKDGFKALDQAAILPVSEKVELGGEDSGYYYINNHFTYAKLMKVELSEGQMLHMDFYGTESYVDTYIEIFREENGIFDLVEDVDHDNLNGPGESSNFTAPATGTYYIAFEGYNEEETGLCSLEVSVRKAPEIIALEEGFKALDQTTVFPINESVELGAEGSPLYVTSDVHVYAKLIKAELSEGQMLHMDFYGTESYVDTYIEIFREENGIFDLVEDVDHDNLNGPGESSNFTAPATGTYYIAFEGCDEDDIGLCTLKATLIDTEALVTGLDFTTDPVPEAQEQDLWSWDATSKTLTLKDGFFLLNEDHTQNTAIKLPDGATVIIAGSATINCSTEYGIFSEGSLTVRGTDTKTSQLDISNHNGDGVSAIGDLTVENCFLSVYSNNEAISSNSDLIMTGIDATLCGYFGILTEGDVSVTDSTLSFQNSYQAIGSYSNVSLFESDTSVFSTIYGFAADHTITITGGKSVISIEEGALNASELIVSDQTVIDWKILDPNTQLLMLQDTANLSLPGTVYLYDTQGNILYEGAWDSSLIDEYGALVIDGTNVVRIENGHHHIYDQQIVSETYLASPATCTESAKYYYSCTCGEAGEEIFADGEPLGHDYQEKRIEPGYSHEGAMQQACTRCGDVESSEPIPVLNIEDRLADVAKGQWFTPFIAYCLDEGLMSGQDDKDEAGREYFRPDSTMTRAELVTVLYNMEGKPAVEVEPIFNDVAAGQWFAEEVTWASQNKIVYGTSPTEFSPNEPISRQDLATILYRYAVDYKGLDLTVEDAEQQLSAFVDVDQIAEYGWTPLAALNKAGVITGDGDRLKPQDSASRGEVASMFNRFVSNVLGAK